MCLRIWRNTLSVQIKDIICMMQADHPFKVNGWSVSFLELAFYFGCPGVNAFGGFVTFVHFVEGSPTNAPSTTAMEEEKEYPSVLTLLPKKVHPLSFRSS